MEKTISVKEMRQNFPKIEKGLKNGESYVLIKRSEPIGKLSPIPKAKPHGNKSLIELFADPPEEMRFKSKKSAVQLVREDRTR
ncbi:MAG: hypothetical protein ABID45_01860 [Patescibacteria group bacterium]